MVPSDGGGVPPASHTGHATSALGGVAAHPAPVRRGLRSRPAASIADRRLCALKATKRGKSGQDDDPTAVIRSATQGMQRQLTRPLFDRVSEAVLQAVQDVKPPLPAFVQARGTPLAVGPHLGTIRCMEHTAVKTRCLRAS
jgi:hypothetical protein